MAAGSRGNTLKRTSRVEGIEKSTQMKHCKDAIGPFPRVVFITSHHIPFKRHPWPLRLDKHLVATETCSGEASFSSCKGSLFSRLIFHSYFYIYSYY